MPTNANAYNSRLTDEALEKRFRDTFRSQGGAELVDDLYASGVIVPVVDFTSAAEGSQLGVNLQTAWDFSTGHTTTSGVSGTTTNTLVTNSGFWQVDLNFAGASGGGSTGFSTIFLDSGVTTKIIWEVNEIASGVTNFNFAQNDKFVVFLRAGDSLKCTAAGNFITDAWYRQIADVSGNLVNPFGFTSS